MQYYTAPVGGMISGMPVPPPAPPVQYSFVSDDGSVGQDKGVVTVVVTPGSNDGTSCDITAQAVGSQRVRTASGNLAVDFVVNVAAGPAVTAVFTFLPPTAQ